MQTFKEENSQHNKSKDPKLFCKIYDTMNNIWPSIFEIDQKLKLQGQSIFFHGPFLNPLLEMDRPGVFFISNSISRPRICFNQ